MRHRYLTLLSWVCMALLLLGAAEPESGHQAPSKDLPAGLQAPQDPVVPDAISMASGSDIAVIKIEGFIYGYTLESLQRRVDQAIDQGASLIVIELDTPGGLVHSALKISKFIKSMPIRSVAWVNNEALSAGILIAASCDQIVMAPAALTGDCAPIVPGQNLAPTERAKALSPLLEEFRDSAERSGYEYAVFHAMCVLGVELYEVRHRDTGVTRIVNQADYAVMVDGKPTSGGWLKQMLGAAANAVNSIDVAAPSVSVATEDDRGQWDAVRQVHNGTTLLTINQLRAFEMGISQNDPKVDTIATTGDLQQFLGASSVQTISPSRVAMIAYWLTTPWVRAILIVVMLVGGYLELQAPGIGIGGISSLIALVLLMGAPYLVGLAQMWHVLLFLAGLLLIGIEIFVTPGMGILGVSGVLFMFVGLILMAIPSSGQGLFPMPAKEMEQYLRVSVLWSLLAVIVSGIGFYYLTRYFGQVPILNKLILTSNTESIPESDVATGNRVSGDDVLGIGKVQTGDTGRVISELRPSGQITIRGETIDVVSVGNWIDIGQQVRVIEINGNRIVVDVDEDV